MIETLKIIRKICGKEVVSNLTLSSTEAVSRSSI